MMDATKKVVSNAYKNRKNRVYYEKCFQSDNLYEKGILQDPIKSSYDEVVLSRSKNEFLRFYGFDQNGSHFDLSLSIKSLNPNDANYSIDEPRQWRLAEVDFAYIDLNNERRYSYKTQELIDYSEKRKSFHTYESRNFYKIGSLYIEIVAPFSLSRIVFNGYLTKSSLNGTDNELISTKLTISTHPNCDKYDFQYRFDPKFITKTLKNACQGEETVEIRRLLALQLDDRIDTPLMYQVCMNTSDGSPGESSIMWGAKVKRFIDSSGMLSHEMLEPMEDLFIWTKVGHHVHLSRPLNHKQLINGMVQSSFDYASCLLDFKLVKTDVSSDEQNPDGQQQLRNSPMSLSELESFNDLQPGIELHLKAYGTKEYKIKIKSNKLADKHLLEVDINDYEGWAIRRIHDASLAFRQAQTTLWAFDLHDREFARQLASEKLLGGKGNSLVELSKLAESKIHQEESDLYEASISVPRGIVVSCIAYEMWLKSNPLIEKSIQELDNTRRTLSARSVFTNPLSEKHLSLAQSQQILREQCKKTCLLLKSCPLPQVLVKHLRTLLIKIFTKDELMNPPVAAGIYDDEDEEVSSKKYKRFAVRSSAVGEDSLETSAAGQMKTILDARGFDAIIRSIVDCWSSQFEPEAVVYKSQNGLRFNLPMAVVVQELIDCKVAGVATTCDPLNGSKSRLQILANPGLGEGVVSGNKTDTIQLSLESLKWDQQSETYLGRFNRSDLGNNKNLFKITSDNGNMEDGSCCLSGEQILALGDLLVWLRRNSQIEDREIEWGITMEGDQQTDSDGSSDSSSSASSNHKSKFHIHLLQSRPLTHLLKLDSREIDHELDYGFGSPINVCSRANLGEVMPGALCPLTSTYFFSIVSTMMHHKPFEQQHTYKPFSACSFAFHGQITCMVLTYTDTLTRFGPSADELRNESSKEREVMFRAMLGTTENTNQDMEERIKLTRERMNPKSKLRSTTLLSIVALDSGLYKLLYLKARRTLKKTKLEHGLTSIENYIEQLESNQSKIETSASVETSNEIFVKIESDIRTLFNRLVKSTNLLVETWTIHIRATLLNMALNAICMKILSSQSTYPDSLAATEILNDFSTLMQGGEKTESGNISKLLNDIIEALIEEQKIEQARDMNNKDLYNLLTSSSSSKGALLFEEFMKKNGHRSFKEFDFNTLTWADDPSYVIKSLAARLKLYNREQAEEERRAALERIRENEEKVKDILENKVLSKRGLLTGYLLPRCKNATVRREGSKSLLIEAISKYRNAFRHLGGLLCLAGRLPSADLVYQMTIEELELFVDKGLFLSKKTSIAEFASRIGRCESGAALSRALYKCRRRQQRARVLNQVIFPQPMLEFNEMVELIKQISGEKATTTQAPSAAKCEVNQSTGQSQVRGLTSCAGCVTGRACVVASLDDMDQIQPNDILITYSIDISWSAYFFTLAGIVTEVGGIVSHGAVVAREYGIPTLCTAVGACSVFKTGQMVTLDANQGVCYLTAASDGGAEVRTDNGKLANGSENHRILG